MNKNAYLYIYIYISRSLTFATWCETKGDELLTTLFVTAIILVVCLSCEHININTYICIRIHIYIYKLKLNLCDVKRNKRARSCLRCYSLRQSFSSSLRPSCERVMIYIYIYVCVYISTYIYIYKLKKGVKPHPSCERIRIYVCIYIYIHINAS